MKIFIQEAVSIEKRFYKEDDPDDIMEVHVTPEVIKKVIKDKNVVELEYEKDGVFIRRIVHIHAFGENYNGSNMILVHQPAGGSISGTYNNMKTFLYSKLGDEMLIYKNRKFSPHELYTRDIKNWSKIYAQI
jgi:hypothetical protein